MIMIIIIIIIIMIITIINNNGNNNILMKITMPMKVKMAIIKSQLTKPTKIQKSCTTSV